MRIDLALLFTWREVARFKNSVNTNLLIMDEVFDSYVKTENVVYGNAPDLPFIFLFEWNTYFRDSLRSKFFESQQ